MLRGYCNCHSERSEESYNAACHLMQSVILSVAKNLITHKAKDSSPAAQNDGSRPGRGSICASPAFFICAIKTKPSPLTHKKMRLPIWQGAFLS
jgi:hypothetical protein